MGILTRKKKSNLFSFFQLEWCHCKYTWSHASWRHESLWILNPSCFFRRSMGQTYFLQKKRLQWKILQTKFGISDNFSYICCTSNFQKSCFAFWLNFQLKCILLGQWNLMKLPNSYQSNLMNYAILFAGILFDVCISILFSTYGFNISLILYFWHLIFANSRSCLGAK